MYKIKYDKVVVATLLALIVAIISFALPQNIVKAGSRKNNIVDVDANDHTLNKFIYGSNIWGNDYPDPSAIKLTFSNIPRIKVTKRKLLNPTLLRGNLKKIKSNHGHIKGFDFLITRIYKNYRKGLLVPTKVKSLKNKDRGTLVILSKVNKLKPNTKYTFLDLAFPSSDLIWRTSRTSSKGTLSPSDFIVVKIPFVYQNKRH